MVASSAEAASEAKVFRKFMVVPFPVRYPKFQFRSDIALLCRLLVARIEQ